MKKKLAILSDYQDKLQASGTCFESTFTCFDTCFEFTSFQPNSHKVGLISMVFLLHSFEGLITCDRSAFLVANVCMIWAAANLYRAVPSTDGALRLNTKDELFLQRSLVIYFLVFFLFSIVLQLIIDGVMSLVVVTLFLSVNFGRWSSGVWYCRQFLLKLFFYLLFLSIYIFLYFTLFF